MPFKKICPQCGKEYETAKRNAKYCSQKCFDEARKVIKTRICQYCGKEFTRYVRPSDEKRGRGKYCSRKCVYNAGRTIKPRPCTYCGKAFTPQDNRKRFCSIECANLSRGLENRSCPICGKEFHPKKASATYCSRKCVAESRKKKRQTKICVICGKIFIPQNRFRIYCSNKCRGIARRTRIKKLCLTCGKPFYAHPSNIKRGNGLYCSEECKLKGKGETFIERRVREQLDIYNVAYEQEMKVGHFFLDFYLPEQNTAIECDGTYWHSTPKIIRRDKRKNKFLKSLGMGLVRLPEAQIRADDFEKNFLEYVFGSTLSFFFFNASSKNYRGKGNENINCL